MKLLLAAERLFALKGPAGTSSRAIMAEAGRGSASAINYYFRTRDKLIEAICELRMEPINRDRIARVAEYVRQAGAADRLPALIAILCDLASRRSSRRRGGSFFQRFRPGHQQPVLELYAIVRDRFDTGIRQLVPLIRDEVPHLPRAIANQRIAMMVRTSGYMSAHFEAHSEDRPGHAQGRTGLSSSS